MNPQERLNMTSIPWLFEWNRFDWSTSPAEGVVVPGSLPFGKLRVGKVLMDNNEGITFPPELELDGCGSRTGLWGGSTGLSVPFTNICGGPIWGITGEGPTGPGTPFIVVIIGALAGCCPFWTRTGDGPLNITEGWGNCGCWKADEETGAEEGSEI